MASSYPGGLDSLATNKTNSTVSQSDHPAHHNDLADAVNKMQATLGVNPQGASADVATRFSSLSGGTAAVFGAPDAELSASTSTTISLTRGAPSSMFNSRGVLVAVGTTTNCEVRRVSSLSGSTFTLNTAFAMSHVAGEPVYWLRDNTIRPVFYGATYNPAIDQWRPIQRAIIDQALSLADIVDVGCDLKNTTAIACGITQPVVGLQSSRIENFSLADAGWTAERGNDTYQLQWMRNFCAFTATASDDKFHITTPENLDSTSAVMLSDPYNFGFPTGTYTGGTFTQGNKYFMQNVVNVSGNNYTFTLSQDSAGTKPVNVTADGVGQFFFSPNSNCKVYLEHGFFSTNSADIGGLYCCPEQPSYIRDVRINLNQQASVQDKAIGMRFPANTQFCNLLNIEINVEAKCLGMHVAGTGIYCPDKITMNDLTAAGAGMIITGNDHAFGGFLLERIHHPAGIRLTGSVRNVDLGRIYFSAENGDPMIDDQTGEDGGSWIQRGGQCGGTGSTLFRGVFGDLLSGPTSGITQGDTAAWGEVVQTAGGSNGKGGWTMKHRLMNNPGGNWTFSPQYSDYIPHSSSLTGTLHTCVGFAGLDYHVALGEAGVTGTKIAPATGQHLIDPLGNDIVGPATYTVLQAGVRIVSMNDRWVAVV